jgi:hypothetical protein
LFHLLQVQQYVPLSLANQFAYAMLGMVVVFLVAGPVIVYYYYRQRKKVEPAHQATPA